VQGDIDGRLDEAFDQFNQARTGIMGAFDALTNVLAPRLFYGRPGLGISTTSNLPYAMATSGSITHRVPSSSLVNTQGIFFFNTTFVGPFASNSPAGQVLQILHELAHMAQGPNGAWLIMNDGPPMTTALVSIANTGQVAAHCADSIRAALGLPNP
jgi:hypothetical protein